MVVLTLLKLVQLACLVLLVVMVMMVMVPTEQVHLYRSIAAILEGFSKRIEFDFQLGYLRVRG